MTEEIRDLLLKIFALAVMMFPLFATPFLIKLAGGVIGKVAGMVNNPNKGPFDKMRKSTQAEAERRRTNTSRRALEREQGYNPATANRRQRAAHRVRRYLPGGGAVADANREAMAASAQKNLASAKESFVADQAAHDPAYQARLAGLSSREADAVRRNPTANPEAARYLQRAQAVATAQEAKAAAERVAAFTAQYEAAGRDGADVTSGGYLEQEYANAVRIGDADRAIAAINRMVSLGAGGKAAARRTLTTHTVSDGGVRDRVTKAVLQDNFNDLVGSHGDIVKGGNFDSAGNWVIDGRAGMAGLSSEQLAGQDVETLRMYESVISQTEAARIMADVQLRSKVKSQAALDILNRVATPRRPSDIRLKHNIRATGRTVGLFDLPEYEYKYLWSDVNYVGVMAQDVLKVAPDAVCIIDGYYHVYYDKLGTTLRVK